VWRGSIVEATNKSLAPTDEFFSFKGSYSKETNMSFSTVSKKSGKTFYLHGRDQKLKGGQTVKLYYFGGEAKADAIDAVPAGYEISENARTGLPFLKKSGKK
jgi:hypothetical protein